MAVQVVGCAPNLESISFVNTNKPNTANVTLRWLHTGIHDKQTELFISLPNILLPFLRDIQHVGQTMNIIFNYSLSIQNLEPCHLFASLSVILLK